MKAPLYKVAAEILRVKENIESERKLTRPGRKVKFIFHEFIAFI